MQRKQVDNALLQKYLEGNCSPEEMQQVKAYLDDPAQEESVAAFMAADWQQVAAGMEPPPTAEDYERFVRLTTTPVRKISSYRKVWRIAAVAATLLTVMATAWYWQQHSNKPAALAWKVWQTPAGKSTVIHLPDSSLIYLGSGSTLQYNTTYNINNRDLYLQGEAYFVVAHGGRHPFSVHTGNITTVDIGTAFNIRNVAGMAGVDVTVAQGKVAVHYQQQQFPLSQRERLHYDSTTGLVSTEKVAFSESIGGWRNGILSFRHMQLKDIVAELERHYGAVIRFRSMDIANITMTSTIPAVPLDTALDIICETAGVHFVKENGMIYLQ